MTPFALAWTLISAAEGGSRITCDARDAGGLTKWGISQRAFPGVDICALTEDGAKELFRQHYWLRAGCDRLPGRVAIALADAAFNQGTVPAIKMLQAALGVEPDGIVGTETVRVARGSEETDIVIDFLARRIVRYHATNGADYFMRGWTRRVLTLHAALIEAEFK